MTDAPWVGEPLTEKCFECGKAICDTEYVVCWGSCSDCLDKSYTEYLAKKEKGVVKGDP